MGKRITDLDPYGSVTKPAYLMDLYEVSKNSGTYGSPLYLPTDTRKITHEELIANIGGIPYSGQNYEVVKATGSDTQNGTNLIVACLACYAKTPNGMPLSATNRATVYFFNGKYNVDAIIINVGQFVDFVGLGTAEDTLIYGNTGNSVFAIETTNDYSFSNFSVENTGSGKSISMTLVDEIDYGKWYNIIIKTATRPFIYNGTYKNIVGLVDEVMVGSIGPDAYAENCNFKNKSYGYSETTHITVGGTIINCIGIDYCFGYSSFGNVDFEAEVSGCYGGDNCFGVIIDDSSTVTFSGNISNSSAGNLCFGATTSNLANIIVSGTIINCKAESLCFGYAAVGANLSISGSVYNCQIGGINGLVHASPNGHKWRKNLGNDGEWQTEDLGI